MGNKLSNNEMRKEKSSNIHSMGNRSQDEMKDADNQQKKAKSKEISKEIIGLDEQEHTREQLAVKEARKVFIDAPLLIFQPVYHA